MKSRFFFITVFVAVAFLSCANKVSDKHALDNDSSFDNDLTGDEAVNDDAVNDESIETDSITDDIVVTDDQSDETIPDNDDIYVPDDDSTDGCASSIDCGEGFFCLKSDGACTEKGSCTAIPQDCDFNIAEPVCGCDGSSYQNRCFANNYGINVKAEGNCPNLNSCNSDADCSGNTFCDSFYEDTCGDPGICVEKALECQEYESAVCGCDGNTYKNMCYAQMAGTGVMHPGGCGTMDECSKNNDCLETEYCHKEQGVCDENAKGVCDLKRDEQECWMYSAIIYVCGCDGVTYQHPCFASSAGTTINHEGKCE